MSNLIADPGHGHSPAAWTGVILILIAFIVGTVAFCLNMPVIVWFSAAGVLVAIFVWWLLVRLGLGVNGSRVSEKAY